MEVIVIRLSAKCQHQANMVNSPPPPKYPALLIETGTVEITQQVLAQNQEIMQLLYTKNGKYVRKNINIPPNPYTGTFQEKHHNTMPAHFDKYLWTNGRGIHKGGNLNSQAPSHKDKSKMDNNMDGSNYWYTEW